MEKVKNQNNICGACGHVVAENDSFCASCGKPLTDLAKSFVNEQYKNAQLKIILKLIDEVQDTKTLLLLKQYVDKIGK